MRTRTPLVGALVGTCLMFGLAAMITIVAFLTFVAPSDRQAGFYYSIAIVCAAEFVLFAWTLNWTVSARSGQRASGATQVIIHVLIGVWLIISIAASAFTAHPPKTHNHFADVVGISQAVFTLIFFALAYALYMKDLGLQREDRQARTERRDMQRQVPGVEEAVEGLRQFARRFPARAAEVARLEKKIDMLQTSLDFAPPARVATLEEDSVASTLEATNSVVDNVQALNVRAGALASVAEEKAAGLLDELETLTGAVESAVKNRQRLLTS